MKNKFNKTAYNIKKLIPREEDIEFNKCTHTTDENGVCYLCGIEMELNINLNDLVNSTNVLISYLETMKMIANSSLRKKEFKVAKEYFDMIPLLKNITALYDICSDAASYMIPADNNVSDREFKYFDIVSDDEKDDNTDGFINVNPIEANIPNEFKRPSKNK